MRPARCKHDVAASGQLFKACIAIDMQRAAITLEMALRPFGSAIRFVEVDGGRRIRPRPSPLISRVDPQPPGFRAAEARIEHGKRGIIRSEEHTSELQSLMRISYAVFCLKKKKKKTHTRY